MRKVLFGILGLFVVLVVTLVAIPFFVDVDKYRPQIVSAINQHIQGELKLGKLKLSLVGGIKVKADNIELSVKGFNRSLLKTNAFYLEIPFVSILTGSPRVIAVFHKPEILVQKNLSGKMNVFSLVPGSQSSPMGTSQAIPNAANPVEGSAAAPQVPGILAAASLGLRIQKGDLTYEDELAKAKYAVDGLDLKVMDLGLMSTMRMEFSAPLRGGSPSFTFGGVARGSGQLTPILSNGTVRSASGSFTVDASSLEFTMLPNLVTKTSAMPMSAKIAFDGSDKDILIKNLEVRFFESVINGKGLLTTASNVALRLELNSNELGLEKMHELVPMLRNYGLKGKMAVNLKVESGPAALNASGDFKLAGGEFSMPGILKTPLQVELQAGFTENSLNILKGDLKGPDSDIFLQGNISNFMAPQFSFNINGKSWNVDKTIVLPTPGASPSKSAFLWIPAAYASSSTGMNPLMELAKNPILAKAVGTLNANLGGLLIYGTKLDSVNVKAQLAQLVLRLQNASFKTFGGQVASSGEFDLRSPALTYKSTGKVMGVSAKDAFINYFPKYQNTLEGITDAEWNISGVAYPEAVRIRSLKGSAKIQARDGRLSSVDFKDVIQGALSKVPLLKNTKAPSLEEGFQVFKADLVFSEGSTKVEPIYYLGQGKGLEIKGKALIQESLEQETFFDVFDPNGILPKEISSSKPAVALRMTGPLNSPKVDYEYTIKKLAGTAGKTAVQQQIGKFLGGGKSAEDSGGKSDAIKKATEELKKKIKLPF